MRLLELSLVLSAAALSSSPPKPVLVLGATGKVGQLVVRGLVRRDVPVRALVRNRTKAALVLADATGVGGFRALPGVSVVAGDATDAASLAAALDGVESVVCVTGAFRPSKLADFAPWRLFGDDPMAWCDDASHPYFVNYRGVAALARLAEAAGVRRVVRLTGLSVGLPATNPVAALFNALLSCTGKWHDRGERALRASALDYTILRPGGLSDAPRPARVNVQAVSADRPTPPPPARVGRADLAELAVVTALGDARAARATLSCRWVGEATAPRVKQGRADDGSAAWEGELAKIDATASAAAERALAEARAPRAALGAAVVVYSALAIAAKVAAWVLARAIRAVAT